MKYRRVGENKYRKVTCALNVVLTVAFVVIVITVGCIL